MKKDVSIIIPAFNEAEHIIAAIDNVKGVLESCADGWEIIVVDDGSSDRTGALAEEKSKADGRIRVVHNDGNRGYGYSFSRGVGLATREYIGVFPGDNDMSAVSLGDLIKRIGEADIITAYQADPASRSLARRIISRTFVVLLNVLFQLRVRYYNGPFIYPRALFQSIPIKSTGMFILAECKIRLLKMGCSIKEITFEHTGRHSGHSKALRFRSIIDVVKSIGVVFMDVHFGSGSKRNKLCST